MSCLEWAGASVGPWKVVLSFGMWIHRGPTYRGRDRGLFGVSLASLPRSERQVQGEKMRRAVMAEGFDRKSSERLLEQAIGPGSFDRNRLVRAIGRAPKKEPSQLQR